MTIVNKTVRGLGKLTGSTFRVIKNAPKATVDKTKDLKDAFIDGLNSDKPSKSVNLPEI